MRRLILFVEGEGEADAAPTLVKKLITELGEWHGHSNARSSIVPTSRIGYFAFAGGNSI